MLMTRRFALLLTMFSLLCLLPCTAQQRGWAQFNFSGAYQHFTHTYSRTGLSLNVDVEIHGKSPLWGDLLLGYMSYEGDKRVPAPGPASVPERVSDSRGNLFLAAGPGFDIFSNLIDRFYVSGLVGYAIGTGEEDYLEPVGTTYIHQSREVGGHGLYLTGRLGYDHQFRSAFVMGGYLEAGTVSGEMRWGVGLKLAYRLGDFAWKRPYGSK